ncbi:MAG: NAD-dependent deacylase [Bryobacteraceae bacterium]|nr:NAD-dependent deacylase [Bryobacteraceae bacterium]
MERAREWLRGASTIVALTGAGISAESGIPTFRGSGGLWREFRPEELATPQAFARDPKLVWEWYFWRRGLIAAAEPNAGHYALAELEARTPHFTLVTQNVDGLHDRAGSRNILKVHGDIWIVRCLACGRESLDKRLEFPETPPRCECGGTLRPGVVWFGEMLPPDVWMAAERACVEAEAMVVAGTSAVVYPAAALAPLAKSAGARVIEVNPEATPLSGLVDCSLRGKAAEILPELVA